MSDRRHKIVHDLDIAGGRGLEIGPLMWPIVTKDQGQVTYVDWADTETLRKKYAGSPVVDPAKIVEVDAIWGEKTLAEAVGTGEKFDYLIASHVIEHVPDLIAWLKEIFDVLKPDGQIRLVVPDKRFTFDFLRRETELSDILNAHLLKARRPSPGLILDYFLNFVTVDMVGIWGRTVDVTTLKPDAAAVEGAMDMALRARDGGEYVDIHCWVFTPVGFGRLMEQLVTQGFVDYRCTSFSDTAENTNEFFVGMVRESDRVVAAASWRRMQDEAAAGGSQDHFDLRGTQTEREKTSAMQKVEALTERLEAIEGADAAIRARLSESEAQRAAAEARAAAAEAQVVALKRSRSWRVTAPLRGMSTLLGRR